MSSESWQDYTDIRKRPILSLQQVNPTLKRLDLSPKFRQTFSCIRNCGYYLIQHGSSIWYGNHGNWVSGSGLSRAGGQSHCHDIEWLLPIILHLLITTFFGRSEFHTRNIGQSQFCNFLPFFFRNLYLSALVWMYESILWGKLIIYSHKLFCKTHEQGSKLAIVFTGALWALTL